MNDIARQITGALRAVCGIAGRRLLDRREQAIVDQALELADQVMAGVDPVAALRTWCEQHGHRVYPGDLVESETAAAVLGIGLARLRNIGAKLPHHRRSRRVYYRLQDLAKHHDVSRPGRSDACSTAR